MHVLGSRADALMRYKRRMRTALVALLVAGCKHKHEQPPVDPDFDAFERKWVSEGELLIEHAKKVGKAVTDADRAGIEAYHGVYIGKAGIIIDRNRVATLGELKTKRDLLRTAIDQNRAFVVTVHVTPMVVFDLTDEPAAVAMDALQLVVGKEITLYVRDTSDEPMSTRLIYSDHTLGNASHAAKDRPTLSVYLTAREAFVGKSVVNELYEIMDRDGRRDLEKLRSTLLEIKSSDAFANRSDIEIAADGGAASDVIETIATTNNAGFYDIAILSPDQLAAKP